MGNIKDKAALFRDPQNENNQQVETKIIELAELGQYESFGEDYEYTSNSMLTPAMLCQQKMNYASVSTMPVELYKIKKTDFYEYLDDKVRKKFMIYLRRYPRDYELR